MGNKSEVTFINTSKETKKLLADLSKSALRESGKEIRKILRENIPVRSSRFKNHIGTWARIDRSTGQPELQVGFYGWQKVREKNKIPSHASPHWVEHGTKPHAITSKSGKAMGIGGVFGFHVNHPGQKGTNVLRNSVHDNIDLIRAVQETYLAELTKSLEAAGAKVHDGEEDESD